MVLAPTVWQGFGLTGFASASSVGSAGLLTFHSSLPYDEYSVDFSVVVIFWVPLMSTVSIALVAFVYVYRLFWIRPRQRRLRVAKS